MEHYEKKISFLGENIQTIRKHRGMKQQELADKIGINMQSLSKIERGVNFPTFDTLEKIMDVLGVMPNELLSGEWKYVNQSEKEVCQFLRIEERLNAELKHGHYDNFFDSEEDGDNVVYVYNWGDYVDPDTLKQFEEETGIRVVMDEFDTNESMYPLVAAGAERYDVICPSDYMIQKMIHNDLLQPLDYSQLPNARQYVGKQFWTQSESFDPGNRYAVPYCWGTVGIVYNRTMVDEPVDSWSILWNEKYKNEIIMQDSPRDSFMVALKRLGYSLNTTDPQQIKEARDMLIAQKPLVQAYGIDDVKDKLVSGEAAMGVVFSGEALRMILENRNLEYVIPKEGTNLWIDSWVIPKNAEHVENAHKFIDFMSRPDIALKNFEYLTYSTPNTAVPAMEEDEDYKDNPVVFPPEEAYAGQETYKYLGEEGDKRYNDEWIQVKVW